MTRRERCEMAVRALGKGNPLADELTALWPILESALVEVMAHGDDCDCDLCLSLGAYAKGCKP